MHVATVVGHLWATQKDASLSGLRLLVVQPFVCGADGRDAGSAETMVAVDTIGADLGERVLVVHGRAARHAIQRGQEIGFQTAIVAIVDGASLLRGAHLGQTSEDDRGTEA